MHDAALVQLTGQMTAWLCVCLMACMAGWAVTAAVLTVALCRAKARVTQALLQSTALHERTAARAIRRNMAFTDVQRAMMQIELENAKDASFDPPAPREPEDEGEPYEQHLNRVASLNGM